MVKDSSLSRKVKMKFLFTTLLLFFSFQTYAFPLKKLLYCSHPNGFALHVNVMVTDPENYRIKLTDQYFSSMSVHQSELTFNEMGELLSISASATVEKLELRNIDDIWVGEYWFDNGRYQLTCKNAFPGKFFLMF